MAHFSEPTCDMLNLTRLAHYCFLILVFLAPLIGGQFDVTSSTALYVLASITVLLLLISGKRGAEPLWRHTVESVSLGIALVLAGLALAVTVGRHASLLQMLGLVSFFLVFLTGSWSARSGRLWTPLTALAAAGIWLGLAAILEYQSYHTEYMRLSGTEYRVFGRFITPGFFNPGFFAGFLAMTLPVSLGLYCGSRRKWLTLLGAVAFLMQLSALLLTGTRFGAIAALLGLLVFIGLLLVTRSLTRTVFVRLAGLVALSIIPLVLFHAPMTFRVAAAEAESHSLAFRILTWQASLNMIADRPLLGFGPGTFQLSFPSFAIAGYTRMAHNAYLQIAAETGVPALLALLTGVAAAVAAALRGLRSKAEAPQLPAVEPIVLCGLVAGVTASLARNFTDSDWYVPGIAITFWLILGLAAGLGRRLSGNLPQPAPARKPLLAVAIAVILGLLALTVALNLAAGQAETGDAAFQEEDYEPAVAHYRAAARLAPLSAEYRRELARSLVGALGDGGLQLAEEQAIKATQLEPTYPTNYMLLAGIRRSSGSDQEALEAYRKAEALDPNSPSIKIAIADILERMGRNEEALGVYREIARIEHTPYEKISAIPELVDPNYAYARYSLGKHYEHQGRRQQAVAEFEAVVERIDRRNSYAYMLQAQRLAVGESADDQRIQGVYEDSKRRLAHLISP